MSAGWPVPEGGLVQVYRCYCSDSAMDDATLPTACPGHDKPVMARVENELPGGVPTRHACAWRACPGRDPGSPDPAEQFTNGAR